MVQQQILKALAIAGAAILATTAVSNAAAAQSRRGLVDGPHIGRCHMGGCEWFDVTAFTMVREVPGAALLRVSLREGGSEHANNRYPRASRGVRIEWTEVNGATYFFCSTRRPAVIYESDGGWKAVSISPGSPTGPVEFITSEYNHICHRGVVMTPARARRLGYTGEEGVETQLRRPEDIFDVH